VDVQNVLRDAGLILATGVAAVPVAALARVPVMVVLVAAGALVGPSVLELVENPVDGLGAWTREELVFLSWCRETGVVPAAIAGLLLARGTEGAELAAALVALAIVTTLLLQATTASPVARRLGLVEEPEYPI
jgi:potassium/hydrogen antiporter